MLSQKLYLTAISIACLSGCNTHEEESNAAKNTAWGSFTPGASIVYITNKTLKRKPGYWFLYTEPIYTPGIESIISRANRFGYKHSEPAEININQ